MYGYTEHHTPHQTQRSIDRASPQTVGRYKRHGTPPRPQAVRRSGACKIGRCTILSTPPRQAAHVDYTTGDQREPRTRPRHLTWHTIAMLTSSPHMSALDPQQDHGSFRTANGEGGH
jgi:hypothetical protein